MKTVIPYDDFSDIECKEYILANQSKDEHPDKQNILQYLVCSNANMIALSFGWYFDPLTEESIGPSNVYVDGVWQWQVTLPYLVEKYNIPLPEEFIEHMRKNNWDCPMLPEEGRACPTPTEEEIALADAKLRVLYGGVVIAVPVHYL